MAKFLLREYTEEIRGNYGSISRKNIMEVKREYLNMYHQAILQLWADDCTRDPGFWAPEDILNFRIDYKHATRNTSGRVSLDSDVILLDGFKEEYKYGLTAGFSHDDELVSYEESNWTRFGAKDISIGREFYNAIRLQRLCQDLDSLYENCGFDSGKEKATRALRINYSSGKFIAVNKIPLTESVARAYAYSHALKRRSFNDVYWSILYEELGIDVSGMEGEDPGLFIKGISYEQERHLFSMVLSWKVELDGEYGHLIKERSLKFDRDDTKVVKKTYKDYFLEKNSSVISEKLVALVNTVLDEDPARKIVLFNDTEFYFTEGISENLLMAGQYTIDTVNKDLLGTSTTYTGDMGEYVHIGDVERARDELGIDIEFSGSPVSLCVDLKENASLKHRLGVKKGNFAFAEYYPIEQVKGATDLHAGGTFFSKNVGTLTLSGESRDALRNQASSAESLKDKVRSTIQLSEAGFYGPIRVDATRAEIREAVVSVMEEDNDAS